MNLTPGIHSVSWEEYVALDCVNHSSLRRMGESPWHYQNPRKRKPSAEFAFGSAFHAMLMEPAEFATKYVPAPAGHKSSNAYKTLAADIAAKGQEPICLDDWKRLENMLEAVMSDPYASVLFQKGEAEQTAIFIDPVTEFTCKARMDWLPECLPNVVVDLKTTKSGNPDSLRKSCWEYGYHTQDAFYRLAWKEVTGRPLEAFLFCFVEKPNDPEDTPLPPQLYELEPTFRMAGEKFVRRWLNELHRCHCEYGAKPWPHYTNGLTELSLPGWAKHKLENN